MLILISPQIIYRETQLILPKMWWNWLGNEKWFGFSSPRPSSIGILPNTALFRPFQMARKWMEKPFVNFPPWAAPTIAFWSRFFQRRIKGSEFVVILCLKILQKLSVDKFHMQPSGLPRTNLGISIKQYDA